MKQSIQDSLIIFLNLNVKLNEIIISNFLSKKTNNFKEIY